MNRIRLRLYAPPQDVEIPDDDRDGPADSPDLISFESARRGVIFSGRLREPQDRARLIRSNSTCPECSRRDVELLELDDGMISPGSRLPVPGTSTIVGFHCNDCGTEWPVYEVVRRNG